MSARDEEPSAAPIGYRDVKIYRPFPNEVPAPLARQGCRLNDVRVAKFEGRVVGAYWLAKAAEQDGGHFQIKALAVCKRFRGNGIGGWLLGHALGIAESRGGRVVVAPSIGTAFFRKSGFEDEGASVLLRLTPE